MILAPGALCGNERFELAERLYVGGMGEIWRATDREYGDEVALKVLRPEFTDDPVLLHRLRAEARNSSPLRHPNIASVYTYWEEDDTAFLSMELAHGSTLAEVLEQETSLPPARLIPILVQCAKGLQAAHCAGVIHRDIKPANIMVTPGGDVKITDFGISMSKGQTAITSTGKVMGTAHYLAPELALGRPATAASDMYALGIVAYECLAGRRPFSGPTHVEIAMAQVRQPPPPLPDRGNPALNALVMRLLAKAPADRPEDCARLASLFTECAEPARSGASAQTPLSPPENQAASRIAVGRAAAAPAQTPASEGSPAAFPAVHPSVARASTRSFSNPYGAKKTRPTRENDTIAPAPRARRPLSARQRKLLTRALPLALAIVLAVVGLIVYLSLGSGNTSSSSGVHPPSTVAQAAFSNVGLSTPGLLSEIRHSPSMERFASG